MASDPASSAAGILGPGSRGAPVRRLQRQLDLLGLALGNDDPAGLYGSGTETAVRAFQRRRPWRPQDGLVDAELGQSLTRALEVREGEAALQALAAADPGRPPAQPQRRRVVVAAVQRRLRGLGLHPGGAAIDGVGGPPLRLALARFRRMACLGPAAGEDLDPACAAALLAIRWLPAVRARWSPTAARRRFAAEARRIGADDHHLAFLDRGLESCPWLESLAAAELPAAPRGRVRANGGWPGYGAYPRRGLVPALETDGLEWLGREIAQACLCRGRIGPGGLVVRWQGRDARTPLECLSATKIIPLLNVLARAPATRARLQPQGSDALSMALEPALFDLVSYAGTVGSSNALAALLNQLEPRREAWIRSHTGGAEGLRFGGRYGETPPIARPELRHQGDGSVLLPFGSPAAAGNAVSVYDLTRLLSMLGWHRLLSPAQRLRGLSGAGAGLAARVLCCDSARYLDAAFADLGLEHRVDTPLILSKMGYGQSALVYSAFLHVLDRAGDQPIEHTLAFTLRCPKGSGDRESVRADLSMAEAVTNLLARTLDGNG
jgi:peptidoglycan hydrolase-like protein with peptidoglycan-binding domain